MFLPTPFTCLYILISGAFFVVVTRFTKVTEILSNSDSTWFLKLRHTYMNDIIKDKRYIEGIWCQSHFHRTKTIDNSFCELCIFLINKHKKRSHIILPQTTMVKRVIYCFRILLLTTESFYAVFVSEFLSVDFYSQISPSCNIFLLVYINRYLLW